MRRPFPPALLEGLLKAVAPAPTIVVFINVKGFAYGRVDLPGTHQAIIGLSAELYDLISNTVYEATGQQLEKRLTVEFEPSWIRRIDLWPAPAMEFVPDDAAPTLERRTLELEPKSLDERIEREYQDELWRQAVRKVERRLLELERDLSISPEPREGRYWFSVKLSEDQRFGFTMESPIANPNRQQLEVMARVELVAWIKAGEPETWP